jgi:hypothetical protein
LQTHDPLRVALAIAVLDPSQCFFVRPCTHYASVWMVNT